jgi:Common central domain of tyrosinase
LRDAFIQLNNHFFSGNRTDSPVVGGVSWWFKQDEIHQATHVHGGPEFLPWHREIVNRLEQMLRQINPQLSLHYWDWTKDPRNITDANLGGGQTGNLSLFTEGFMGYGGPSQAPIGEPWLSAKYYVPGASPNRDNPYNPADPPTAVIRSVVGSPATVEQDNAVLSANDYHDMRMLLEATHNDMHGFVRMGGQHISFRDPFVFLLHSNVDRLFALWQTDPAHPERLNPDTVYGSESNKDVQVFNVIQNVNDNVEPWSTGHSFDQFGSEHFTRPWCAPENEGIPHTYKDPTIVTPPLYYHPGPEYFLREILSAKGITFPASILNVAEDNGFTIPFFVRDLARKLLQ